MKSEEKVTCPFCGAEIDPDTIQCPSCGNGWSDAEEREVIRAIRKIPGMGEKRTKKLFEGGLERIKDADEGDLEEVLKKAGIPLKIADEIKDRLETDTSLHMCPECGAFVPGDANTCPICGADLSAGEEEVDFTQEEINDVHQLKDDLYLGESPNLYLCRVCGAFIMEDYRECPVCKASMPDNRADMPLSVEDKLEDEERNLRAVHGFFGVQDLKKLEKIDTDVLSSVTELDICSSCGAFVRPEAMQCPVCGSALVSELDENREEDVVDEALLALEELKNELIGGDIESILPEESEYVCSECGSPVPEDADRCPVCGTVFEEDSEEESHEELVLSLEDVLSDDEIAEASISAVEPEALSAETQETHDEPVSDIVEEDEERIKEEMKEEVDFIFAPVPAPHGDVGKGSAYEKEELAMVLEGGMDEISPPEKSAPPEEDGGPEVRDEPIPDESGRWTRAEDIVMAASAIGAALMASEYLLTNGIVSNPLMAYGASSVSIFLSLMLAGLALIILDRKEVFRTPWASAAGASILVFPVLIVLLWYLQIDVSDHMTADLILLGLYFAGLLTLWKLMKEQMNPLWIWFLGISQIAAHSLMFVFEFHPWLAFSDPVPSYALALAGGGYLSLGIYLRVDAGVRSLLSTRDVLMGHRHYMNGDYDEAMKYYSRALDRRRPHEGGYDLAYYSKGTALLSAGNSLDALKFLNRAVKANPENDMAWNNRGIALSKLGLDEGALKSYERALMINPAYDVAWNNKGNVLARMGRYIDALECYDNAIRLNPDYKDAWMNKGYVLIKMDRYSEAKECADHVLRPKRQAPQIRGISPDIE